MQLDIDGAEHVVCDSSSQLQGVKRNEPVYYKERFVMKYALA